MLRALAALLVRSSDARFILADLDEIHARDLAGGMSTRRAAWRYARNALASAWAAVRVGRSGVGGRAAARGRRALRIPGVSWLDVKLAVRMLGKHPGLTLVAGFALAIAIPLGVAPLQFLGMFRAPLPFDQGDRIFAIQDWDLSSSDPEWHQIHDWEVWRDEATTFQEVAATYSSFHNVITDDGRVEPVRGADMTPSGFRVLRVGPALGRVLLDDDAVPGAAPVVVIGYDLWQSRFGGSADVIGRTLQVGAGRRAVVGVMPRGFLFPFRDQFWTPFSARAVDYERRRGPLLWAFGRLRDGVTLNQARGEVAALGARTAAAFPATHEHLRAEVIPFQLTSVGARDPDFAESLPIQLIALMLLVIACGNVGILTLARSATREGELAVRTALGASRRRIVAQLFVESLVLSLLAAGAGLAFGSWVVRRLDPFMARQMPFWLDLSLRPATVAVALGLAVFGAVLTGVLPGLKATGGGMGRTLQRAGSGEAGFRFGTLSSVLVVAEVALSVAFLSVVGVEARNAFPGSSEDFGVPANEYLAVRLSLPDAPVEAEGQPGPGVGGRNAHLQEELARRLAAEPRVRGVAFASQLPGMDHSYRLVELEDGSGPVDGVLRGQPVRMANVAPGYFAALDRPVRSGRTFDDSDLMADAATVIVNRSFVERVLHGRNPIGVRVRYAPVSDAAPPPPWLTIVGVVDDLGMSLTDPVLIAGMYRPMAPGSMSPVSVAIRVDGDPLAFVPRLRAVAAGVDAELVLRDPARLDQIFSVVRAVSRWGGFLFGLIAAVAVVLSAAGLYALMSFTVTARTRELGIRTALGARPRRIIAVIASKAMAQLLIGVSLGVGLGSALLSNQVGGERVTRSGGWVPVLVSVSLVVIAVGVLACLGPARRGLSIQPSEALRDG